MSPEARERLYARIKELKMKESDFHVQLGRTYLELSPEEGALAKADQSITMVAGLLGLYPEWLRTGTGPRLIPEHELPRK
jgi:hypothetical protein